MRNIKHHRLSVTELRMGGYWLICHCAPVRFKFMSFSSHCPTAVLLSSRKVLALEDPRELQVLVLVSQVLDHNNGCNYPCGISSQPIGITVEGTYLVGTCRLEGTSDSDSTCTVCVSTR